MSATTKLQPLEMNPQIRARWVATLRSGDIPQTTGILRGGEADGRCCLGVLCDLAVADGVIPAPDLRDDGRWHYDGADQILPVSVAEWAGLGDVNPSFGDEDELDLGEGAPSSGLAELNDYGWSFAQIADAIDGKQPAVTT